MSETVIVAAWLVEVIGRRTTLALSAYPGERKELNAALDGALTEVMRPLKREGWFVASLRIPPRALA